MIARAAARGDPQQAVQYILHGKGGEKPERADYVTTRNFAEPDTPEAAGPTLSFLTADASTERPLYQVILSLPKGERFTAEQVERVTDRVLWSLGAQDRLTVVALHRDGDGRGGDRRGGEGGKDHLHILINRVGPDGRLLNLRGDRYRLQVAMATLEVEHGWRRVAELPFGHKLTDEQLRAAATTLETPFATLVEPEIARQLESAGSWGELHEALGGQGLRLQRRFDGMWITDGFERAALDPSMFERLGRFKRPTRLPMEAAPLRQRLALHVGRSLEHRSSRAVDHLTEHDVVFSRRQLAAVAAWDRSPDALRQSVTGAREVLAAGEGEYTTARAVLEEEHVLLLGDALKRRRGSTVALGTESLRGLDPGQREALAAAVGGAGLALITGRAGTGKTTTLARVRGAYEAGGWRVLGAAPTGKAAEGLQKEAGISSATIASWLLRWGEGRELPDARTVVVVDEAGMVGTGDMRRVLEVAEAHGARVRLVGDANQLAPVAGGQPFRALGERHGAALMETVWRQREPWQKEATSKLANFQVGEALHDYAAHQRVEGYRTREQAVRGLVAEYLRDIDTHPAATRLALTATKADRGRLNEALRGALVERGLVEGQGVGSAAGELAVGDRIVFRRNDHVARHVKLLDARGRVVELAPGSRDGVKNGSLGTVVQARVDRVDVALDDGRRVRFNPRTWQKVEHAYALHVDLAQGATVDRAYVLAGERFQRNGAYVALSRHRDDVKVFFDRETFPDRETLAERFGRGRYKQNLADLATEARSALSGRARVVYGLQAAPATEPATMVAEGGRAVQEEPRTEVLIEPTGSASGIAPVEELEHRREQLEGELQALGYRMEYDAGAIPGEGHLLLDSAGELVEADAAPEKVLALAREWSDATDRLEQSGEPHRLDLFEAELRLHQVDAQRAWSNVEGVVDRSFTEPEKALEAMRQSLRQEAQSPTSAAIEASMKASPLRGEIKADTLRAELRPRLAAVQDHQLGAQRAERRIEAYKSERVGAPETQVEALKSERVGSPELAASASELRAGRIDAGEAVRVYRDEVAPRLAGGAELSPELQGQVEQQAQAVLELRDQERAVSGLEQQVDGLREPKRELTRVEARLEENWKRVEQVAGRAFAEPDRAVEAMREAVEKGRPIPEVLKAAQGASDLRGGGVNRAGRREARQALNELSGALTGVTQQHKAAERLRQSVRAGGPALASAEAALGRAQQALVGLRRGDPEASLSDTLRALSGSARTAALAALPPKLQVIARPVVRAIEATRNLAPDLDLGR